MKKIIFIILLCVFCFSCSKSIKDISNNTSKDNNLTVGAKNLRFNFNVKSVRTRGIMIDNSNLSSNVIYIGVFGAKYANTDTWNDETTVINYLNNLELSRVNNFETNLEWPSETDAKLKFFAYSPSQNTAVTCVNGDQNTHVGSPRIKYVTPESVADQVDLLYGSSDEFNGGSENFPNPIFIQFKHALTGLVFSLDEKFEGSINKITIKGVKQVGEFSVSTGQWSSLDTPKDFALDLNYAVPADYQPKTIINPGDKAMLLIPQDLTDVKIKVEYSKGTETGLSFETNLTGLWRAGIYNNYIISLSRKAIIRAESLENFVNGGEL